MSTEPKNELTSANSSQVELSNSGKIFTSLAAGGIAGGIAKTVIAPLDRYKYILTLSHLYFAHFNRVSYFFNITLKQSFT